MDPLVREAWGPVARADTHVLISVATVLHLVVRPYMTVVAEGLPKYPAPPELYPLFRQHRPLPEGVELSMHPVDNSVQMGHMAGVVDSATTLRLLGALPQILPERSAPAPARFGFPDAAEISATPKSTGWLPYCRGKERSPAHTAW